MYRKADYKFSIPQLPDELKHATTDREKAYIAYIHNIVDTLKKDFSTGLEHREQFESTEKGEGIYIFIDGDGLKKLNDHTKDHAAGDAAIRALGLAIQSALRSRDDTQIARMGGDEFTIFVSNISLSTGVMIAKRILDSIRRQSVLDLYRGDSDETKEFLKSWQLTASLGVGKTKQDADKAMYKAKSSGRNRVDFISDIRTKTQQARAKTIQLALIRLGEGE